MTDNQKKLLADEDFMKHLRQIIFHYQKLQQVVGSELTPAELLQHERILIEKNVDFDYIRRELGEVYERAWLEVLEQDYAARAMDAASVSVKEQTEKVIDLFYRFQRKHRFE